MPTYGKKYNYQIINKDMKKLLDIISQTDAYLTEAEDFGPPSNAQQIQGPITSSEDERVGVALQKLDQIGEMVDDLYNTISHLEIIDVECDTSLTSAYNVIDDLYAKIDEKYDIIPVNLDDDDDDDEDYSDLEESFDLDESVNLSKIKELVAMSLIDEKDVPGTIAALKAAQSPEKVLTKNQISLLANLSVMLTNVILGDTAALSSVKRAAKE